MSKKMYMNKLLLIAGFVVLTSFGVSTSASHYVEEALFPSDSLKVLKPKEEHASESYVITNLLKRFHYRKMELSDSISSVIYNNYFESIDPNKAYFYKEDVAKFENQRFSLHMMCSISTEKERLIVLTMYMNC